MSNDIAPRPRPGEKALAPVPAPAPVPAAAPLPVSRPITVPIASIAKAISGVMKEIGTVHKGGYNKFHGYAYARMEDLLSALTPLMGKHGLAIFQSEAELKMVEGNRIAVTYEFTISHESGETWPERQRFTGMAMARDSKGNIDDKMLNKAHTAARKYFLLSLFQVPTSDVDDSDPDENQPQARVPSPSGASRVPLPPGGPPRPFPTPKPAPAPSPPPPSPPPSPPGLNQEQPKPHKITLGQGAGVAEWRAAYIAAIDKCTTRDEILAWDAENDPILSRIHREYPQASSDIQAAVERKIDQIETPKPETAEVRTDFGMPNPQTDPSRAKAWVVAKLLDFRTYEAAENFWNAVVAPLEGKFMPDDWDMLMREWARTETRLGRSDDGYLPEPDETK